MIRSKKIKTALFIKKANGSFYLIIKFLLEQIFYRNKILKKKRHLINDFKIKTKDKYFKELWFDNNIPYWHNIFEKKNLIDKNLKALEIGSFEGRSAYYFLTTLKNLKLYCIDTWKGSEEQGIQNWNNVEKNFDINMKYFQERFVKFKGSSSLWYQDNKDKINYFDLIYIDGSHYFKDVLYDAENCWKFLKPKGIMMFDDYLWNEYKITEHNPIFGINQFLNDIKNRFNILHVDTQLFIEKRY